MNDYTYKDNSKQVLSALEQAIEDALFAVGAKAETHAKKILSDTVYTREPDEEGYQLTGRLRNSITFALSGKEPNTKEYDYKIDGEKYTASYKGTAPNDSKKSVYIGTNVVYAAGIETGSHRKAGGVHYLQKAATNYKDEYKTIFENSMKNAK